MHARGATVTAREIASRAGVSSSTFYAHFGERDELLAVAFDIAGESLRRAIAEMEEAERKPKLARVFGAILEWRLAEPSQAALLRLELAVFLPNLQPARAELMRWLEGAMEQSGAGLLAALGPGAGGALMAAALELLLGAGQSNGRGEELAALFETAIPPEP